MATAVIRLPEVLRLTGLSRSTIYELMEKGAFPRNFALGCRAVGWGVDDIEAWIEQRRCLDSATSGDGKPENLR
jgi:prophage regulatory protein